MPTTLKCNSCGYDLRGLPMGAGASPICPECGTKYSPRYKRPLWFTLLLLASPIIPILTTGLGPRDKFGLPRDGWLGSFILPLGHFIAVGCYGFLAYKYERRWHKPLLSLIVAILIALFIFFVLGILIFSVAWATG